MTSTGSLRNNAPGGITARGLPENVSVLSLPGVISPPPAASAKCAAPIVSGWALCMFETEMRTRRPPMLARTTMRTVWSASDAGTSNTTGRKPAPACRPRPSGEGAPWRFGSDDWRRTVVARSCCAVAQVDTQCSDDLACACT
jgi:hypothetical protein